MINKFLLWLPVSQYKAPTTRITLLLAFTSHNISTRFRANFDISEMEQYSRVKQEVSAANNSGELG